LLDSEVNNSAGLLAIIVALWSRLLAGFWLINSGGISNKVAVESALALSGFSLGLGVKSKSLRKSKSAGKSDNSRLISGSFILDAAEWAAEWEITVGAESTTRRWLTPVSYTHLTLPTNGW
jgi:hypothetical protein